MFSYAAYGFKAILRFGHNFQIAIGQQKRFKSFSEELVVFGNDNSFFRLHSRPPIRFKIKMSGMMQACAKEANG